MWPNAYIGQTYADEVGYLKTWLTQRLAWMDASMPVAQEPASGARDLAVSAATPNPARGRLTFEVTVSAPQTVQAHVFDARGRRVAFLLGGEMAGTRRLAWDASGMASGVYLIRVQAQNATHTQTVTLLRR